MKLLLAVTLAGIMLLTGCTTIISEQSRRLVDTKVSFAELKKEPNGYVGKHIMLGGRIAGVKNTREGAQLEIVQFELNDRGIPEDSFISHGRFLATSSEYLDAMVFRHGMLITMVGEIKGKKLLRLEDMDYVYPLVALREWYLWPGTEYERCNLYPSNLPGYDPYYYGYGFEPFWSRPFAPAIRPW